jgi:histidine ammonia-lyase
MLFAREGPGVTAAQDPVDESMFHIYALGGRDDAGDALASYEYLSVTIQANGNHTVSDWAMLRCSPKGNGRCRKIVIRETWGDAKKVWQGA